MKITVIGSGYVGLVSGICFAKIGHEVVCVDNDPTKIDKLNHAIIPIYEPGLKELLEEAKAAQKISFTTDLEVAMQGSKAIFIAVGTPQDEDGSANMSYVFAVAKEIAQKAKDDKLIITKSTVPVGTGQKIAQIVRQINPQLNFGIASNPEFLREGAAIDDFMNPDRVVVGVQDDAAKAIMSEIYSNLFIGQEPRIVYSDITTAELIKYASNSFLATKISFINEMADLCEAVGGDVKKLSYAMGLDSRIGEKFLNPGPGFGGSCFPKDIMAILNIAKENDVNLSLIHAVITSNKHRKVHMVQKIKQALGSDVAGKKIALLGLAFKANTDDIRYSPAVVIAAQLSQQGAIVATSDPQALHNAQRELANYDNITYHEDPYSAIAGADLIVIVTEWQCYKELDLAKIKTITQARKILDLRNILDAKTLRKAGFEYYSIGQK